MTSKHTPGPWVAQKGAGYYVTRPKSRCAHVVGVCNRTSLVDGDCEAEAEANARLIAAAPDLLEALKSALNALSACSNLRATDLAQEAFDAHVANGVERHRLEWFVDNSQEIASAEAAIAKAEGRQ